MVQKQQVDLESSDIERALAELKKAGESDAVYRSAGNLLVKANKENVTKDLIEKKELSSTRSAVLTKQEQRVRENLKDLEAKIQDAVKTRPGPAPQANAQSP